MDTLKKLLMNLPTFCEDFQYSFFILNFKFKFLFGLKKNIFKFLFGLKKNIFKFHFGLKKKYFYRISFWFIKKYKKMNKYVLALLLTCQIGNDIL